MKKSIAKLSLFEMIIIGRGIIILILFGLLISFITVILFMILCAYIIIFILKKKHFTKKLMVATLSGVVLTSSIYIYEMYLFTFSDI